MDDAPRAWVIMHLCTHRYTWVCIFTQRTFVLNSSAEKNTELHIRTLTHTHERVYSNIIIVIGQMCIVHNTLLFIIHIVRAKRTKYLMTDDAAVLGYTKSYYRALFVTSAIRTYMKHLFPSVGTSFLKKKIVLNFHIITRQVYY